MKQVVIVLFAIAITSSCSVLKKTELAEQTLFSIDSELTFADEFLYVYEKNNFNNDSIYTDADIDEYFELFLNFKLKVAAAKSAGLDTTEAFLTEFETYKDQLIKPYLSESKEQEKLVTEAYERMKYEVDASHILVSVAENASPQDTAKAYQKIMGLYEKTRSGEDFGALAGQFSEDPSAKSNQGRLGYFTAFQMVYVFEEAAYNTPVDSISGIVRSRFGYHIVKVHDKRSYSGKVKVSHIMLRVNPSSSDSSNTKNKIFEIHDQILGGADWNELCERFSEDQRTKSNGGTLPFIGMGQINDPVFENTAFGLDSAGEISDPIKSRFGWHIIRLEEKQGLQPFDELKGDLEKRVSQGDRQKISQQSLIRKLKADNKFNEVAASRAMLLKQADSTLLLGKWISSSQLASSNDTLFLLKSKPYPIPYAINYIESNQRRKTGIDPEGYMNELLDRYIEHSLLQYEEEQLIATNRDFRMLLNEYYEGILLFEIMDTQVWGKAVEDTIGLKEYFESTRQKYYWSDRVSGAVISSGNINTIDEVENLVSETSFRLSEIELDATREHNIITNDKIDALTTLYRQYDLCEITIYVSDSVKGSKLYEDLLSYFDDLGIADSTLAFQNSENSFKKIKLVLNSRSKKSLEYLYNKESALNLQVDEGLFEKGENQWIDSVEWETGVHNVSVADRHHLVVIDEILESQPKKLKDVKGLVISDYQNYLEKNWIEQLRHTYTVEINEEILDQIKKSYKKKLNSAA